MTTYEHQDVYDFTDPSGFVGGSAQTFTVGTVGSNVNHNITGASIFITEGFPYPTANVVACIYNTNSSGNADYSSPLVTSSAVLEATLSEDGSWINFTFSSNPTLTTSNKYAIGITATSFTNIWVNGQTTGSYSGGVWETHTASDMAFKIYGTASSTVYNVA
ncbi:MAG: hypothetical protein IMZ51_04050, partial [Chloroflexi bacterium]|nr:hypothetical protein [Chloroflexota bacterium]